MFLLKIANIYLKMGSNLHYSTKQKKITKKKNNLIKLKKKKT